MWLMSHDVSARVGGKMMKYYSKEWDFIIPVSHALNQTRVILGALNHLEVKSYCSLFNTSVCYKCLKQ